MDYIVHYFELRFQCLIEVRISLVNNISFNCFRLIIEKGLNLKFVDFCARSSALHYFRWKCDLAKYTNWVCIISTAYLHHSFKRFWLPSFSVRYDDSEVTMFAHCSFIDFVHKIANIPSLDVKLFVDRCVSVDTFLSSNLDQFGHLESMLLITNSNNTDCREDSVFVFQHFEIFCHFIHVWWNRVIWIRSNQELNVNKIIRLGHSNICLKPVCG